MSRRASRLLAGIVVLLGLLPSGAAAKDTGPDVGFLLGFLAGEYRLIGQKPEGGAAYTGRVTLRVHGRALDVSRTVGGKTVHGTAAIETATADRVPVLRMRFKMDGEDYEGTYLWRSDLDNYPRLSGYVYKPGARTKSPGLEALFVVPAP